MEGGEEGGEEAKRKKRNASQSQRPASSMLAACYATLRVEPLLPLATATIAKPRL